MTTVDERSARGAPKPAKPKPQHAPREGTYWVRHQHDDVRVVQGEERPDTTPETGERLVRVYGPYHTRALAEARADKLHARTFAALRGERRAS